MKQPEKIDFSRIFMGIRSKMNITEITRIGSTINSNFNWQELEISADDINLTYDLDGIPILRYKGEKVLLYIKDQAVYTKYETEYKFHIAGCRTLINMSNKGQYNKYVVSRRQSNIFPVRIIKNGKVYEENKELHVCKNCLTALNYHGYKNANKKERNEIYISFSIQEFFNDNINENYFHGMPKYDEYNAPTNIYTKNWGEIATILKKLANYKCQRCGKDYSNDTKNLHVHHKDGNKSNNLTSNLIVLCFDCHHKEHSHLRRL